MSSGERRVTAEALRGFGRDIFVAAGMSADHAAQVADVLVWADLRGVGSHGVERVPRYLGMIEAGGMNPAPDMRITTETVSSLMIEADRAPGPVAMGWAMDRAMEKARETAIGWALVRQMTHSGAIGYYSLRAAREGLAGLAFVSSLPNMAYHGARTASIATSPITIAVPGGDRAPVLLDMSTAVVAGGKITQARNAGVPIPEGWALDDDGNPTTDGARATIPMPLGGPKGAGLSLMMECLISLMVGNPIITEEIGFQARGRPIRQNGLCIAVDIAKFIDPQEFRAQVDALVDLLKNQPAADGVDEILVPGERGDRVMAERGRDGIPMPTARWENLGKVAEKFSVAMPATV